MLVEAKSSRDRRVAASLAQRLAPQISAAIAAELAAVTPEPAATDRDIMAACVALGRAVDRLEQVRFAGAREAVARLALETAAFRVARLIKKKGAVRVAR